MPLICLALFPTAAIAELRPDQVIVLANRNSVNSVAVAEHYADRRGIPPVQVVSLPLSLQESIGRDHYETEVVQPLRQALQDRQLAGKIRAVVTVYGVPLRVGPPQPTDQQQAWAHDARERSVIGRSRLERLAEGIARLGSEMPGGAERAPSAVSNPERPASLDALFNQVAHEIDAAASRLKTVADQQRADRELQELVRFTVQFGGVAAVIQNIKPGADPSRNRQTETLKKQIASAQMMIQVLNQVPSDRHRDRAYRLAERAFGLQGILRLASAELDIYSFRDADASLDSELSLLWWPEGTYHIAGRSRNLLYQERQHGSLSQPASANHLSLPGAGERGEAPIGEPLSMPILMVSRLDAPTPQLAKRLVDQALETEQRGLEGSIYLDARGLDAASQSYGYYDQSLRDLAELFRHSTSYRVVLDNTERRFSDPGEAHDVAVYTGWYRLRSYEDAFTFRAGALGYHIASAEAVSLHDPQETGWCKNALEHGIAVTLGSVGEPLLDSFPVPSHFWGLLLTGRYSVVEAYYLTTRYLSWRMVLIGDPLYNPWRTSPAKDLRWEEPLPEAPSSRPFPDPRTAMAELSRLRDIALSQIDRVLDAL